MRRYFQLSFVCTNIQCNERFRYEELIFDFMKRGHCSNCKGRTFEVVKTLIDEPLGDERLVRVLKNVRPKDRKVILDIFDGVFNITQKGYSKYRTKQ